MTDQNQATPIENHVAEEFTRLHQEITKLRTALTFARADIDASIIYFEQQTGERALGLRQTRTKILAVLNGD